MLTLAAGCACDVCAEEYGPNRLPHSIPCGHVLCASCCTTIVEKTSPRLAPVCPFCREQFTSDSMRLIRMDFPTSGWSTPRRFPAMETFNDSFINSEMLQRKTAHLMSGNAKGRIEVRRLEEKVARVAAKKCSVEEVSSLYKELEEWLLAEKDDQTSSLLLSAALLRAILMNHLAHSDASKAAKATEANLKNKIEDLEEQTSKIDAEVRRQRSQYNQKSQECQQLRLEVGQLRALATTVHKDYVPDMSSVPTSPTPSPSPYSQSSSHYSTASSNLTASPLRSSHTRSASMSSRPTTPAVATPISPTRSHTPANPRSQTPAIGNLRGMSSASAAAAVHQQQRSHTPGPSLTHTPLRSQTPAARSQTPGPTPSSHYHSSSHYGGQVTPPVPSIPPRYAATPAPPSLGNLNYKQPAAAPMVPPKPRRLSTPSPPKMMARSTSEEKAEAHERWLPTMQHDDDYIVPRHSDAAASLEKERQRLVYASTTARSASVRPPSRMGSLMSSLRR